MWKLLGTVLAVAGVGALIASSAEGSSVEKQRRQIRKAFSVSGDCFIEFKKDPADAASFWRSADPYLRNMIELAATLQITDSTGVASYTMLNLFPECDQSKEQSMSFVAVMAAMQTRIAALMENQP